LQILSFDTLDSTQEYLKELLHIKKVTPPLAITADMQTKGIGSRDNSWEGFRGNIFVSFSMPLQALPEDLKLESASLYFSYILKETLAAFGSKVWLKWPNDFYIDEKKVGGLITHLFDQNIVCGFGINLHKAPDDATLLDINIDKYILLKKYFKNLEKKFLWKQVFSKYELEFHRNKSFSTHTENKKIYLDKALLQSDGSLIIDGMRMYSLR